MTRRLLAALLLVAAGCHHAPPSTPASPSTPPSPSPSPSPAGTVDHGPVEPWYRARAGRLQLNPAAPAEDLSFAIALLDWLASGREDLWPRLGPRVEQAWRVPEMRFNPPFVNPDKDGARLYHQAAAPLSARPQAERDGAAEDRLYRKAVLLDPTDPDLYNHLAIGASLRKDYAAAERYAKLAIAIDPSYLNAYQELAYAYKNAARYDDAVEVADRGVKLDGDLRTKAMLLARKGQALWLKGERDAALAAFTTSRRLGGPEWVESYLKGEQEIGQEFRVVPAATPTPAPPAGD